MIIEQLKVNSNSHHYHTFVDKKISRLYLKIVHYDHPQDIYGMHVTQCLVRDGLGWSEQGLINEEGCPQDYEIMGELEYSASKTTALVKFQAHKFPYTSSVYYQCNVKLCIKHAGGCDQVVSNSSCMHLLAYPSILIVLLISHLPTLARPSLTLAFSSAASL